MVLVGGTCTSPLHSTGRPLSFSRHPSVHHSPELSIRFFRPDGRTGPACLLCPPRTFTSWARGSWHIAPGTDRTAAHGRFFSELGSCVLPLPPRICPLNKHGNKVAGRLLFTSSWHFGSCTFSAKQMMRSQKIFDPRTTRRGKHASAGAWRAANQRPSVPRLETVEAPPGWKMPGRHKETARNRPSSIEEAPKGEWEPPDA